MELPVRAFSPGGWLQQRLTRIGPMVSVVRVPGGRAAESIKSLAIMQAALNSNTILVIHHTGEREHSLYLTRESVNICLDCGLTHLTDQDCRDYLVSIAPEDKSNIAKTKFGEIRGP